MVRALVELIGSAEEERAGCEEIGGGVRAVFEGAGGDDRDRGGRVPLFERTIVRTGGADHVRDAPAVALGERGAGRASRLAGDAPRMQRALELDRNFRQDSTPSRSI